MTEALQRSDQLARRRALDANSSFIVQAPAGSGKTELLIQRFLTLLARVDAPEEVVAITFTRKAAGEMRNRVLDALAAASAERTPENDQERITLPLAQAALAADQRHGWSLVDNPARLRIFTIDALCLSLSAQMPLLSRMGAEAMLIPEGVKMAVNYGLDRVRFLAPVKSGKRVRGRFTLDSVEEKAPGQVLFRHTVTVEIEGEDKPALTALWLGLVFV